MKYYVVKTFLRLLQGIKSGLGKRGFITKEALKRMASLPEIMSCSGHVKVIDRTVYFRYGGFWHLNLRLHRFIQTVKMIQVTRGHVNLLLLLLMMMDRLSRSH